MATQKIRGAPQISSAAAPGPRKDEASYSKFLVCLSCYTKWSKGVEFIFTDCGHVYCGRCFVDEVCVRCRKKVNVQRFKDRLTNAVEYYTQDACGLLKRQMESCQIQHELKSNCIRAMEDNLQKLHHKLRDVEQAIEIYQKRTDYLKRKWSERRLKKEGRRKSEKPLSQFSPISMYHPVRDDTGGNHLPRKSPFFENRLSEHHMKMHPEILRNHSNPKFEGQTEKNFPQHQSTTYTKYNTSRPNSFVKHTEYASSNNHDPNGYKGYAYELPGETPRGSRIVRTSGGRFIKVTPILRESPSRSGTSAGHSAKSVRFAE